MPSISQIQIRQQPALIGIDADIGKQEIEQPRAEVEMRTNPPRLDIHSPNGELKIDQTRAWQALGSGGILWAMQHIYTEAKNVALQGIARIVEKGNRLAAIHLNTNPIADIGQEEAFTFHEFNYFGPAGPDNVDIEYIPHKPEIQVEDGNVEIHVRPNPPKFQYTRGKLDIYVRQYASVEIIPPQIDYRL